MSEMSAGIRALEMQERQAWHRERAYRESGAAVVDGQRRRVWRRTARRAA